MTRIKICGITNEADARFALLSGADYLGFIFYRASPRATTVETVIRIVQNLGDDMETGPLLSGNSRPLLVGVFVNETPETVAAVLSDCGLDLAQLNDDLVRESTVDMPSLLEGRSYRVLQPRNMEQARVAAPALTLATPPNAPTLLIDTYHPALRGGTGETADWEVAAELVNLTPRLMLAGGLNPSNVAEAVRQVRPFAVDVASGVEASYGIKDPQKVAQFIQAARQVSQ